MIPTAVSKPVRFFLQTFASILPTSANTCQQFANLCQLLQTYLCKPLLTFANLCRDPANFCRDPATFYQNLAPKTTEIGGYHCTIEVFEHNVKNLNEEALIKQLMKNFKEMELITKNTNLIFYHISQAINSFPIFMHDHFSKESHPSFISTFKNISTFGKNKPNSWFMNDILIDVYNTLQNNKTLK